MKARSKGTDPVLINTIFVLKKKGKKTYFRQIKISRVIMIVVLLNFAVRIDLFNYMKYVITYIAT